MYEHNTLLYFFLNKELTLNLQCFSLPQRFLHIKFEICIKNVTCITIMTLVFEGQELS